MFAVSTLSFFVWYVLGVMGSVCIAAIFRKRYRESFSGALGNLTGWSVVACLFWGLAGPIAFAGGVVVVATNAWMDFVQNNETWGRFSDWLSRPIKR